MTFKQLPIITDIRKSITKHKTKKYRKRKLKDITKIAIHHSLTKTGSAMAYANYHVNHLNWPSIGYHFVIEKNGDVKWCLDLETKSYHVGNSNSFALGICLTGDFRTQEPTQEQINSMYILLNSLLNDLKLSYADVLGHSEFKDYSWKKCPELDMNQLRRNIKNENYSVVSSIDYVAPENNTYTIKSGDTLWDIGANFNITVKDLLLLNPKLNPTKLKVNQVILIK